MRRGLSAVIVGVGEVDPASHVWTESIAMCTDRITGRSVASR
jgi:hypothetical protein